jgi:inner membrane protease subunit 1
MRLVFELVHSNELQSQRGERRRTCRFKHMATRWRVILISLPLFSYAAAHKYCIEISGSSMLPTLNERGDRVVLDPLSKWRKKYLKGDIVVAYANIGTDLVCKRITALEGDVVHFSRLNPRSTTGEAVTTIEKGFVWLEGDNKEHSVDSRQYGPVSLANLEGRVVARIWPLNQLRRFRREA